MIAASEWMRRRAIERRRAFEELWAREAARRQAELNILIEQLIGLRPKSSSKFQARPIGGYVSPAATEPEPAAADPDQFPKSRSISAPPDSGVAVTVRRS